MDTLQAKKLEYALWPKKSWINQENPYSRGCTGRYLLNKPGRQNMCKTGWDENKSLPHSKECFPGHAYVITLLFINWNRLWKLISKLPVPASKGIPLSIHRVKGKKLSYEVYPCMFQLFFVRVWDYLCFGNLVFRLFLKMLDHRSTVRMKSLSQLILTLPRQGILTLPGLLILVLPRQRILTLPGLFYYYRGNFK